MIGIFSAWILLKGTDAVHSEHPANKDTIIENLENPTQRNVSKLANVTDTTAKSPLTFDSVETTFAGSENDSFAILGFLDTLSTIEDSTISLSEDSLDVYRDWELLEDSLKSDDQRLIPKDVRTVEGNPQVLRDVFLLRLSIPVMEEYVDSNGGHFVGEATDSPLDVSFWQSPVNYKGYRKSGNTLVVFGIYATDSVKFLRTGPHLYMDVLDARYLITESYEFKHLIEISKKRSMQKR